MLRRFPLNRDGTFIENFATENHLWLTLLALHFANKHFRGMIRDDGSQEITHATATCCGLIDREILLLVPTIPLELVDIILTAALLHDLVENTSVTVEDIKKVFGKEIAHYIGILTKRTEHKKDIRKYYRRVGKSEVAVLVKTIDKLNVAGSIIKVAKTVDRIERQANEARILLPMMKRIRKKYPVFKGMLINCRDAMKNILIGIDAHIEVVKENDNLKKENERLKKRLNKFKKKKKYK